MRGITLSFLLQLIGAIALVQGGLHVMFKDAGLRYSLIETGIGAAVLTVGLVLRVRERRRQSASGSGSEDPAD